MASPASDTSSLAATQRHTSSHTPDRGKPAALHAPVATSASPENGVSEAKRGEPATLEPKSGSSGSDDARATAKGETSPPKAKPTPENTSINKEEDTGESVGHGKTNHRHKRPSSAHKSTAVPLFDASGAQLSGDSTDDEEPSGVADNKSSKSDPVAHQGHTRKAKSQPSSPRIHSPSLSPDNTMRKQSKARRNSRNSDRGKKRKNGRPSRSKSQEDARPKRRDKSINYGAKSDTPGTPGLRLYENKVLIPDLPSIALPKSDKTESKLLTPLQVQLGKSPRSRTSSLPQGMAKEFSEMRRRHIKAKRSQERKVKRGSAKLKNSEIKAQATAKPKNSDTKSVSNEYQDFVLKRHSTFFNHPAWEIEYKISPGDLSQWQALPENYSFDDLPSIIQNECMRMKRSKESYSQRELFVLYSLDYHLHHDQTRFHGARNFPQRPFLPIQLLKDAESTIRIVDDSLLQRYIVKRDVGDGGFGAILLCQDMKEDKRVAIKVLHHNKLDEISANFAEVASLLVCSHENILKYDRAWVIPGDMGYFGNSLEMWFVTDYIPGVTFEDVIHSTLNVPESVTTIILHGTIVALEYLHSKKMGHRDVKSSNVVCSVEGEVKLIDMGLCCEFEVGPRLTMVGSKHYLPPEMLLVKPYNWMVDIWSTGVCGLESVLENPLRSYPLSAWMISGVNGDLVESAIPPTRTLTSNYKEFLSSTLVVNPEKRKTSSELLQLKLFSDLSHKDKLIEIVQKEFSELKRKEL